MKVCPKCQRTFDDAGVFCPHDGARLAAPTTPVKIQPQPSNLAGTRPQDGLAAYRRMVGQTLDGRYKLESLLGEGGMGVVFRATHTVIEKPVAIKLLKREVAREDVVVARFLQEAKAASRVNHPNLVDVTDFGTLPDGLAYFVMEFIDGRTLARIVKDEAPVLLSRALPIIVQLARGLAAAHQKGVVHRDLKPDNIFVVSRPGEADVVKIVDFGIAKVVPEEGHASASAPRLTRVGSVFGTPEYMAPEQAAGRADIDLRADIYALGIIFYELIVGRVPFEDDNLVAVLAMQMLDPIKPPTQARPELVLAPGIEAVIMRCLAKERDARYASMGEFLAALEAEVGAAFPADAGGSMVGLARVANAEASGAYNLQSLMGRPRTPTPSPGGTPPGGTPPAPGTPPGGLSPVVRTASEPPPPAPPLNTPTLRTAGPDERTYAPDPEMLSPFRRGGPQDAATMVPPEPLGVARPPVRITPDTPTRQPPPPSTPPPLAMRTDGPPPPAPPLVPAGGVAQGGGRRGLDVPPTERIEKFAEPLTVEPSGRATSRRVLIAALLVAIAVGVVVFWRVRAGTPAATTTADAAPAALPDAAAAPATDAAPAAAAIDAGAIDAVPAVPGKRPPGKPVTPTRSAPPGKTTPPGTPSPPPYVTVRVFANPPTAELRGFGGAVLPNGTSITQPYGTRLRVDCRMRSTEYTPGSVDIVFDGSMAIATCATCSPTLRYDYDPSHPCNRKK